MNQLCKVCGEMAAGYHFGAFTCEGCKSFFGRTYNNRSSIGECKNNNQCSITKKNRTSCKSCRLRKCFKVGMSKSGSRYGRRSNWFKIHCLVQDQAINMSGAQNGAGSPPLSETPVGQTQHHHLQSPLTNIHHHHHHLLSHNSSPENELRAGRQTLVGSPDTSDDAPPSSLHNHPLSNNHSTNNTANTAGANSQQGALPPHLANGLGHLNLAAHAAAGQQHQQQTQQHQMLHQTNNLAALLAASQAGAAANNTNQHLDLHHQQQLAAALMNASTGQQLDLQHLNISALANSLQQQAAAAAAQQHQQHPLLDHLHNQNQNSNNQTNNPATNVSQAPGVNLQFDALKYYLILLQMYLSDLRK